jgi:hypothetical protein
VLLETHEILVRGALRRKFAFDEMRSLSAAGERLAFRAGNDRVEIDLGDQAVVWLARIRNPRSRAQKLGLGPGMKVAALGPIEPDALLEIADVTGAPPSRRLRRAVDLVLLSIDDARGLAAMARVRAALAPGGALWVLWPKGRRDLAHEHVAAAGRAAGFSQTKSLGFSDLRTALRFVRAAARR